MQLAVQRLIKPARTQGSTLTWISVKAALIFMNSKEKTKVPVLIDAHVCFQLIAENITSLL